MDATPEWSASRDAVPDGHVQSTVYDESGDRVATVFKSEANVKLVTAAPDLFAACDKALEAIMDTPALDGNESWNEIVDCLNAAIEKVRG